jgi:peptidyl-tRNA hydrolase, PTH1 family
MWILVPLGNPGDTYAATRHNLGRLMLQRWMEHRRPRARAVHDFPTGTLYGLGDPYLSLVPGSWMNHSGLAVAEAVAAGFDPARMILLFDDKDLPLGLGRFRLSGGDGGHNGVKSVLENLGGPDVPRLRLGIGPYERPLVDFVLGEWTDDEWERIGAMDRPFARFMELLKTVEDPAALLGQVNAGSFWNSD